MYDARDEVSTLDHDYDFTGGSNVVGFTGGFSEPTPQQTPDVWPGDIALDPEETDLNTLASLTAERTRLRELAPGSVVMISKHAQSFEGDVGASERCEWQVSVSKGDATGICYADVAGMTLREACDSALAKFRADQLDTVQAPSAETAAA